MGHGFHNLNPYTFGCPYISIDFNMQHFSCASGSYAFGVSESAIASVPGDHFSVRWASQVGQDGWGNLEIFQGFYYKIL